MAENSVIAMMKSMTSNKSERTAVNAAKSLTCTTQKPYRHELVALVGVFDHGCYISHGVDEVLQQ